MVQSVKNIRSTAAAGLTSGCREAKQAAGPSYLKYIILGEHDLKYSIFIEHEDALEDIK
jgi:hypothetical protein